MYFEYLAVLCFVLSKWNFSNDADFAGTENLKWEILILSAVFKWDNKENCLQQQTVTTRRRPGAGWWPGEGKHQR